MTAGVSSTRQAPVADELRGLGHFGVRTLIGLAAVIVGALPFLLLLHLVQDRWAPLAALDGTSPPA